MGYDGSRMLAPAEKDELDREWLELLVDIDEWVE